MVEFQQLDVGNIQTKLKKLIGAARPSPDGRTQDKVQIVHIEKRCF